MRHGHAPRLGGMREVPVVATATDLPPSVTLEPLDDRRAVHMHIVYASKRAGADDTEGAITGSATAVRNIGRRLSSNLGGSRYSSVANTRSRRTSPSRSRSARPPNPIRR